MAYWRAAINRLLTIKILTPLTNFAGREAGCFRLAVRFAARRIGGLLVARIARRIWIVPMAALIAAAGGVATARAQGADPTNARLFMPYPDGDPKNPQRFVCRNSAIRRARARARPDSIPPM
jgi:hypothetical protein